MLRRLLILIPVVVLIAIVLCNVAYGDKFSDAQKSVSVDYTSDMEDLGQPFSLPVYARNIWDMQVFGNRVYLGCGNSSNKGPSSNAGPVPVIYYDTEKGAFVTQTNIGEEQIDIYRIIDDKLVIPGHDSKESWAFGNYYTMVDNSWKKTRTIPDGVHVYDIAYFNGNLFAATGTDGFGTAVMSGDMGKTWVSLTPKGAERFYTQGGRAYSIFQFKNKLYFAGALYNGFSYYNNFLCVSSDATAKTAVTGVVRGKKNGLSIVRASMLPGAERNKPMRMVRINEINGKLLYISGFIDNDHQWLPDALYTATDIGWTKRIELPEQGILPMDIIARESTAYLLSYKKTGKDTYENKVYRSEDMYKWTECFRFTFDTFARSFEELDGDFYFGLGCNTGYLPESTGKILRIKKVLDVTSFIDK